MFPATDSNLASPFHKNKCSFHARNVFHNENEPPPSDEDDPDALNNDDSLFFIDDFESMDKQYSSLIYANEMKKEPVFLSSHLQQESTCKKKVKNEHRAIVVDWLIRVADEMSLLNDTLFCAVSLFDRVIAIHQIKKCHIQLFGATCLWIASKIEETMTPAISDFVFLCNNTYIENEFIECERVIINILHFKIISTNPMFYAQSLVKDAFSQNYILFFCKAMILHEDYGNTLPSVIAISSIFLTSVVFGGLSKLELIDVDVSHVVDCVEKIKQTILDAYSKKTGALYEELLDICEQAQNTEDEVINTFVTNVNADAIDHFLSQ